MHAAQHDTSRHYTREISYFNAAQCHFELTAAGVDGVIASTVENITYLTGYDHWPLRTFREHGVYAVVTADGRRGLVAPRNAGEYLATAELEDCVLVTHGDFFITYAPDGEITDLDRRWEAIRSATPSFPTAASAVASLLDEFGIRGSDRLALDDHAMSHTARAELKQHAAFLDAVDGNTLLQRVRRIKTAAEVVRIRDVARRTEVAMNGVFESVEIGTSEVDLWDRYQRLALDQGMVPGHCEVNIGKRASGCFPPDANTRAALGDTIRIDCGARLNGYSSDTGRNANLGAMAPRLQLAERAIRAGIEAMFSCAAPGVRVVDLVDRALSAVRQNGLPEFNRHHVGHGIGVEMYEFPVLTPRQDPDVVLVEGEVLNFEVPFYEMGTGGLQIEDTVLVTQSGIEILTVNSRTAMSIQDNGKWAS